MFKDKKLLLNLDFNLLLTILAIFAFGMIMVASATNLIEEGLSRKVIIQGVSFLLGLVAMAFVLRVDYNLFGEMYKLIYIISIFFMLLVYVPGLGVEQFGARCWIKLGPIFLQTSEVAKIGFILFFAKYIELHRYNNLNKIKDLVAPLLTLAPFVILLLLQPDLGIALIFMVIAFGMLFVAGLNGKIIFKGFASMAVMVPLAYHFMKPHQRLRIDAFLNPNNPNLPGNYHVMQSKITIGTGKFFGRGIFDGIYHKYGYLPVKESDFIFAVTGEETGFIGGAILIFLYYNMLRRMMAISREAKDIYGSLVATGVTFMFAFNVIENLGMTMGIMPVTGVPLPFFSYGGSNVITNMLALGIILNVYMRRKRINFNLN